MKNPLKGLLRHNNIPVDHSSEGIIAHGDPDCVLAWRHSPWNSYLEGHCLLVVLLNIHPFCMSFCAQFHDDRRKVDIFTIHRPKVLSGNKSHKALSCLDIFFCLGSSRYPQVF